MGSYVPSTPAQRQEMLEAIGLHDFRQLYRDAARSSGAAVPSFRDQVMVQKALRDDLISNSIRIKYKNIGIFQI